MPNILGTVNSQTGLPTETTKQLPGLAFSKGLGNHGNLSPAFRKTTNKSGLRRYNFISYTIAVGLTPLVIVGAGDKVFLEIQNQGSADVFLGFGVTPLATGLTNAIKLVGDAVQSFTDEIVPYNEIQAISGTANQAVTIVVGVPI